MTESETKAGEIPGAPDYDRSTITPNRNSLTNIGTVERRSRTPGGGGRVYLYSVKSDEEVRRQFRRRLDVWVADVYTGLMSSYQNNTTVEIPSRYEPCIGPERMGNPDFHMVDSYR